MPRGWSGCRDSGNGATLATLTDEWQYDSVVIANYNRVISPTKLNVVTFSSPRQSIQTGVPGDSPTADTVCVPCLSPTFASCVDDGDSSLFASSLGTAISLEDAFSWFVPGQKAEATM